MVNFANNIGFHARGAPGKPALIAGSRRLSWSELDALTDRFANHLDALGLDRRDRVAIYAFNTLEFVIAFFGAMKHGAIAVPLNKRLEGEDLARILTHAAPSVVVAPQGDAFRFEGLAAEILTFGDGEEGGFWEVLAAAPAARIAPGAQGHEIANLLYTSGTTGQPKAVVHTHLMRHAVAGAMANRFALSRNDVGLAVSPFFHTGGLSVLCNCIHAGGTCVLMPKWDPALMLAEVTRHDVTFAHFVSTLVVDITDLPDASFDAAPPRLRMTWSGGHSVDTWRLDAYERRMGGVLLQGYSRTEGGLAYNFPDPALRSFAHNGYACRDSSDLAIYDADAGRLRRDGGLGEIVVRGDGVSPGYWNPDGIRPAETVLDGWARTGDWGRQAPDGAVHFEGRIDHMIKSGGENVFPAEVEKAILQLPGVQTATVLGVADPRLGEIVAAIVVRRGAEMTEDDLRERLRAKLAGYKLPRLIRFVDDLPRLGSGKVDLARSRQILMQNREGTA